MDYGLKYSTAKRQALAKYYYQEWRQPLIDQYGKGIYAVFTEVSEEPVILTNDKRPCDL